MNVLILSAILGCCYVFSGVLLKQKSICHAAMAIIGMAVLIGD